MVCAPRLKWVRNSAIIAAVMRFEPQRRRRHRLLATLLPLLLAACQQQPASSEERTASTQSPKPQELPLPSPDTGMAGWTVTANGKGIAFGNPGADPWLTLDCRLSPDQPPEFAVIRHASALPGQTALFAVMGNGHVSRLNAAAVLADGEWRWEASLPAADPAWDLFIGSGDMRATLPGKGAIEIPPNPVPGEFVSWCRAGGRPATPSPEAAKQN